MRAFAEAISALPSAQAEAVKQRGGSETFRALERGEVGEWVPTLWNVQWVEAVHAVVGEKSFEQFFRDLTRRDFDTSLFKSFVAGALRLFGNKLSVLVRRIPAGYTMMWRDSGDLELTKEWAGGCELTLSPLPESCLGPIWIHSVRWGLHGIFDVLGVRGESRVRPFDPSSRRVSYELSW
jgi:hypothetical protein